ncbi:uncharacterized protein LOC122064104 [Macadamia integrifolia]|uniref:uncharacterized protein LOC122064104 n=1 Tax=Macadamia integrifolia TaxID=60698 RepID=UPI001C4FC998|nr:uncharacterized protein LOC122064104 [Macadamia integrifolia]
MAYNLVVKEVNSKHPQHHKKLAKDNVVNCFRTIKQTFRNLLLCLEQSGFSFDHAEKKLNVEDQIWYPFAVKRKDKGTTSEEPRSYIHPVNHMEIGETDGSEDLNTQVPMSTSYSEEESGAGAPQERKGAKVALDGQIFVVAASVDRLATMVQERHISPKSLLDTILEVDGFSKDTLDIVFEFLIVNEPQAKAFLVKDVEQRRKWILRFLDQSH